MAVSATRRLMTVNADNVRLGRHGLDTPDVLTSAAPAERPRRVLRTRNPTPRSPAKLCPVCAVSTSWRLKYPYEAPPNRMNHGFRYAWNAPPTPVNHSVRSTPPYGLAVS